MFIDYTTALYVRQIKMLNEKTARACLHLFLNKISISEIVTILYYISIHRRAPLGSYLNDIK